MNLATHQPIALLPDRTAETLTEWLKAHPGVEILSRDRSKTYKRGMSAGAPEAIQVADRFHLLHNLEEVLEKVFKGHLPVLKRIEQATSTADLPQLGIPQAAPTPSLRQQQQAQKRAQRLVLSQKRRSGRLGSRFPRVIYRQFRGHVPSCPVQVEALST